MPPLSAEKSVCVNADLLLAACLVLKLHLAINQSKQRVVRTNTDIVAGVSQSHLRRVELGQADITIGHLQLLCDAMSISIQEFFKEESSSDETAVAFSRLSPKQKTLLLTFLESL